MKRRGSKDAENPERTAYDRGLSMLARREHSQRELRARLEHGGYDEAEAAEAIQRLGQQNYQDDGRFGEMLLRARIAHGYGPARIRAELLSHGLKAAGIDALIQSADVDWNALALTQLRKKYGSKPATDHAERGKRAQFLLRRGFAAAMVRAATHAEVED
ncbi:MAG TPA: regulatory protein RecX [Rhodanobacteraceae bacterium]|nr:regulatory protein RecX [Rhodanobacteraceae bacterium]